mmetsp:Transcript_17083/g.30365  ORF Transcript_17083/g.30365 Transcript_17083/m.30365 type:complete len:439 (+) Transcript_17083:403-1719(+)
MELLHVALQSGSSHVLQLGCSILIVLLRVAILESHLLQGAVQAFQRCLQEFAAALHRNLGTEALQLVHGNVSRTVNCQEELQALAWDVLRIVHALCKLGLLLGEIDEGLVAIFTRQDVLDDGRVDPPKFGTLCCVGALHLLDALCRSGALDELRKEAFQQSQDLQKRALWALRQAPVGAETFLRDLQQLRHRGSLPFKQHLPGRQELACRHVPGGQLQIILLCHGPLLPHHRILAHVTRHDATGSSCGGFHGAGRVCQQLPVRLVYILWALQCLGWEVEHARAGTACPHQRHYESTSLPRKQGFCCSSRTTLQGDVNIADVGHHPMLVFPVLAARKGPQSLAQLDVAVLAKLQKIIYLQVDSTTIHRLHEQLLDPWLAADNQRSLALNCWRKGCSQSFNQRLRVWMPAARRSEDANVRATSHLALQTAGCTHPLPGLR